MRPSRLQTEFNDIFNACNRLLFVCFDHVHKKKLKLYCKLFGIFFLIQGLLCLILIIGLVLLARFLTLLSFFCTFLTNPLNSYRS